MFLFQVYNSYNDWYSIHLDVYVHPDCEDVRINDSGTTVSNLILAIFKLSTGRREDFTYMGRRIVNCDLYHLERKVIIDMSCCCFQT